MELSFLQTRIIFLEDMIKSHPENKDLIQAYAKLLEKEVDYQIRWLAYNEKVHSINTEFNKNLDNNHKDYALQQLKMTK